MRLNKTDNRHYTNRSWNRKLGYEVTYWCWWHGETMPYVPNSFQDDKPIGGLIVDVEYIGNAMRGNVLLTFENGTNWTVQAGAGSPDCLEATKYYRPRKCDLKLETKSI